MPFHRLRVPTYFGGLPSSGYDYINNAASGTPALHDSKKAGGPNAGTYFVAFGEDATSKSTNRPIHALAENCDYLDDLFRRDLAVPIRTSDVTATTAVSSITLTGPGIFLGASGTPNTAAGLNTFLEVLDENDREIVDATGTQRCRVAVLSGGTVGSGGFSEGSVTLTVSPAIPAGKTYRVYYGVRGNLATMPVDAFTNITIRGAQEVSADLLSAGGAALIGFAGSGAWADGTTNPQSTVEAQLDKIVSDLASTNNGAAKIGSAAVSGTPYNVPAGTLHSQITRLVQSTNSLSQTVSDERLRKTSQGDTLEGPIQLSGAGRILPSVRTGEDVNNWPISAGVGNATISIPATLTGDRTYRLVTAGVVGNEMISMFVDPALTYKVTVQDQAGNPLFVLGNGATADGPWATFLYVGGWRLYQHSRGSYMRSEVFTSSVNPATGGPMTWTCPRGVTRIMAFGYGGGSAGGRGAYVGSGANRTQAAGGGGGGGSHGSWRAVTVVPGMEYSVTIGAGGVSDPSSGGSGDRIPGADGGDTLLAATGATLMRFLGARAGAHGFDIDPTNPYFGAPIGGIAKPYDEQTDSSILGSVLGEPWELRTVTTWPVLGAGAPGGRPNNRHIARGMGNVSETGVPTRGGATGVGNSSSTLGNGGGGGGGPGGDGASGGHTEVAAWRVGGHAGDNTGAGGGGGSAAPWGEQPAGGRGGSGKLTIYYVK